jgi:hypothetical protein
VDQKIMGRAKHSASNVQPGMKPICVHLLWHTDRAGDEKLIGVYEKETDASMAIKRVKDKPWFSEEGGAVLKPFTTNSIRTIGLRVSFGTKVSAFQRGFRPTD